MLALVAALVLAAEPPGVRWERVDVLSEDPGVWLHHDAWRLRVDRLTPTVRFLSQVKVVWSTPVRELGFGVSVGSQSLVYEYPLAAAGQAGAEHGAADAAATAARGLVGVAWRAGPVRLGLSLSVFSEATWSRLNYQYWTALPTLGLGFGRSPEPPVP